MALTCSSYQSNTIYRGIYSSYLNAGDRITTSVVLSVCGTPLSRGAHAVLVVFTHEYTWKIPELGLEKSNGQQRILEREGN